MIANFDPPQLPVKQPGIPSGCRAVVGVQSAETGVTAVVADTAAQPVEFGHAITYVNKIKVFTMIVGI